MKRINQILALSVVWTAAFIFNSCNDDNNPIDEPPVEIEYTLDVEDKSVVFEADQTSKTVNVITENVPQWSAKLEKEDDSSWLSVKKENGKLLVTVTRTEEMEDDISGNIVISDDNGYAKTVNLPVTMKVEYITPPPPPEYKLEALPMSVELLADGKEGEYVDVTTNVESWTPSVGLDYTGWLSAVKVGDRVYITANEYDNQLLERTGIVVIVADNDEVDPVEIKVTQLKKPWGTETLTNVVKAYYLGDQDENGLGRFELQLDQNNIARGFNMEGYSLLAADPDNFILEPGEYTFGNAGQAMSLFPGVDSGSGTLWKTDFSGTYTFLASAAMATYSSGVKADGGKITVEKNGEIYRITAELTGDDFRTDEPSADRTIYVYEGPIEFENHAPQDIETFTGDALLVATSFYGTGSSVTLQFLMEGTMNRYGTLSATHKLLEVEMSISSEVKQTGKLWIGTYTVTSNYNSVQSQPGWIRPGNSYSGLNYTKYVEKVDNVQTMGIRIDEGTVVITEGDTADSYNISTDLIGIDPISSNEYKFKFTHSGELFIPE